MGKALMPLEVLNKPGKLTAAEFDIIKGHPQRGHELLKGGAATPPIALDVCLHHHERPDGTGYPFGLKGDALTTAARMGAVCDVYDAITSNRPYKVGWDPADSVSRMTAWTQAGQFDPAIFASFVKSLGVYPVGSLVRMRSGRLAVVVEQSTTQLLKPWVKVFYSTKSNLPLTPELDTSDPRCSDAVAARESNAVWKFPHLDELWAGRDTLALAAAA
jgi:HD-GYP domain-containing protein (c-di-GMP phosphodiesterase class II)